MDVDSLIENIADIESRTFSDAWSEESITDSMEQDYNVLFVAFELDEDVRIKTVIGGPDYDKVNDTHISIDKENFVDAEDYVFAGYLMANIIIDESELLKIAVSSELQRRGIGRSLMYEYFEYIKPYCKRSILEVRQSNIKARRLYEALGYKSISVRKDYYNAPVEDAVIYEYKINETFE
ncbi:MAG: ribosomal protein S18-alanine N-acetyltransferase [Lachnospiraceae bacterium]|nr:ribosomal protein S18-alanine N-acetyltransferase [Lachnospiraceae bacterium]